MFTYCSRFTGLLAVLCLFFLHTSFAQTPDAVRIQLNHIHALLDKSQIPTGYLWDNGYAFVKRELTKKTSYSYNLFATCGVLLLYLCKV